MLPPFAVNLFVVNLLAIGLLAIELSQPESSMLCPSRRRREFRS
jgi:hypothetical protein